MKKKIIISLILAMCCIMASIPASAVDICDDCDPIFAWCRSTGRMATSSHYVYIDNYNGKSCEYEIRVYEECEVCMTCGTETYTRPHGHGKYNHDLCGAANSEGCSLGH